MTGDSSEHIKKAKAYALRLFKLRPRSMVELKDKLQGKGYEQEIIECVVRDSTDCGLLDDAAFARAWMQGRLKRYGFRRVSRELAIKGIPKDLIQSTWDGVKSGYDEEEIVRSVVARRSRVYQDLAPLKRKKRLMDYLVRRGFNIGIISKVIRDI